MAEVFGVILAGGEGMRLDAVRKGDIRIGGRRLVDRAADVFRGRVAEILVSTPVGYDGYLPDGAQPVADDRLERQGPLAGFRAVARHVSERAGPKAILVFLAVDTPFAPDDYLERLLAAAAERRAAVARWGDIPYPTNSAFRLSDLRGALETVSPNAGPKAILHDLAAQPVDWSDRHADDPFANLNTLADLIALQRRALEDLPGGVRQRP